MTFENWMTQRYSSEYSKGEYRDHDMQAAYTAGLQSSTPYTEGYAKGYSDGKSTRDCALGWTPNPVVNGCVEPARIYRPIFCTTTWFKNFAFQCGACGKESVVFTLFGTPTCPYCGIKNTPLWEVRA